MLLCPRCRKPLARVRDGHGDGAACAACGGRALTFRDLRTGLPSEVARALAHAIRTGARQGTLPCPSCSAAMVVVDAGGSGPPVVVTGCPRCPCAWFDPDGVQRLAPPTMKKRRVRPANVEDVLAAYELSRGKDMVVESGVDFGSWEGMGGYLGLPTMRGQPRSEVRAWATWILAGALVATWVAVLVVGTAPRPSGLGERAPILIERGGFVPRNPGRAGGVTWITSGFLHASLWHLFANVYMLLLAGRPVERALGHARYLALYFLGDLAGNLLEVVTDGTSLVPRIGASGAIAGLFGYFAFAMPKVDVGLYFADWRTGSRFTLTRLWVPVPWVFGAWTVLQLIGLVGRDARIAFASHVGGSLTGVGWWAVGRWRAARAPTGPPVLPAVPAPAKARPPPLTPASVLEPPRAVEPAPTSLSETGFVLEEVPPRAPAPRPAEQPASPAPVPAPAETNPLRDSGIRTEEGPCPERPSEVARAARPRAADWTVREGIGDAARGLLRRAAGAAPVWAVVCVALAGLARSTAFMGVLIGLAFVFSVVSLLSGVLVGHLMGRDLIDEVRFAGWIPAALAVGAAVVVVVVVEVLVAIVLPFGVAFYGGIVAVGGAIGAVGGALKATWASE